jgi:hypothetical protein
MDNVICSCQSHTVIGISQIFPLTVELDVVQIDMMVLHVVLQNLADCLRRSTKRLGMSTGGIGIAVKIEDGNINILYAAVMEILVQLGIGTEEVRNKLRSWHTPSVFNTMGIVTGVTSHSYIVRRHSVVVRGERDEGEERAALASFI